MVDCYLKDCVTQHPGGWQDIIDFVNANYDRYQASYVVTDASVKRVLRPATNSNLKREDGLMSDLVYKADQIQQELPRLEMIHSGIAGVTASMGWAVLKSLGLPLPGSKEWLKPCSQWRKDEKS